MVPLPLQRGPRVQRVRTTGLVLVAALAPGCKSAPEPAAPVDGAAAAPLVEEAAASAPPATVSRASPAPGAIAAACADPTLDFGPNERMRWGTEATVVVEGSRYALDLGRYVTFVQGDAGGERSQRIELVCGPVCDDAARAALATKLETLRGHTVRATGVLRARWHRKANEAPVSDADPFVVALDVGPADLEPSKRDAGR